MLEEKETAIDQLRKDLHKEIDLLNYDLLLLIAESIGIR